jgi:hypothetical protein
MAIYCHVVENIVVNRALFDGDMPADWPDAEQWFASEEAQIGWSHDGEVFTAPPVEESPPVDRPLQLVDIGSARLAIDGFDVTSIDRTKGMSVAFVADVDIVWIFFDEPQLDTEYVVTPSEGVTKYADRIEVTKPGLAAVSLIVQRVI